MVIAGGHDDARSSSPNQAGSSSGMSPGSCLGDYFDMPSDPTATGRLARETNQPRMPEPSAPARAPRKLEQNGGSLVAKGGMIQGIDECESPSSEDPSTFGEYFAAAGPEL